MKSIFARAPRASEPPEHNPAVQYIISYIKNDLKLKVGKIETDNEEWEGTVIDVGNNVLVAIRDCNDKKYRLDVALRGFNHPLLDSRLNGLTIQHKDGVPIDRPSFIREMACVEFFETTPFRFDLLGHTFERSEYNGRCAYTSGIVWLYFIVDRQGSIKAEISISSLGESFKGNEGIEFDVHDRGLTQVLRSKAFKKHIKDICVSTAEACESKIKTWQDFINALRSFK
jgi:hypothetical protein